MWLSQLKSANLKREKKYPFLISMGSLEQHGPYGPLGTDTYIQDALLQLVELLVPEVIFLPTIPISESKLQLGFPGSVSLEYETVSYIFRDIVNSLKDYAQIIFFVSWHGGNKPIIDKFIHDKQSEFPNNHLIHIAFGDDGTDRQVTTLLNGPPDDHAGNTEISLMQYIKPEYTGIPDKNEPKHSIEFNWDQPVIKVFSNGVVDSHSKWVVSAEIGEKLLNIYANNLAKKIQACL